MKLWKAVFGVVVVLLIVGGVYVWMIISRPASDHPGAIETYVAEMARSIGMPGKYRQLPNPLQPTPANIEAGMAHFADHCAICHNNNGDGDTLFGRGLYPKPPDLRGPGTQHKTDGDLYYIVENGIPLTGMPAFGQHPGATDDLETWHLIIFLKHIPSLTDRELAEMAGMNPKTDADRQEEKEEQDFLNGASSDTSGPSTDSKAKSKAQSNKGSQAR